MTLDGRPAAAGPSAPASGPLSGVRVLELGSLIAGPFAARLLADFGADVVKVEDPSSPDPLRQWGDAEIAGHQLWWSVQSRNKRCVTLDLRGSDDKDRLLALVEDADVLIENFRPGTLERLGLGPDVLLERNPRLVLCRISGFGQSGPGAELPGYASVAEAVSGLRALNGFPDRPPPRTGISLGDSLASLFAVHGILVALYWRDVCNGTGQIIDVSLVESCFALLESAVPDYAARGVVKGPSGTGLQGIAPSNLFHTADGRWVVIAANQDSVFRRLAAAMGAPELTTDERYATHGARGRNQVELESLVAAWADRLDWPDLASLLREHAVPHGLVSTIADVFANPLFHDREMLLTVTDPVLGDVVMPGVIPKLSATPGRVEWSGRVEPGADNDVVLGRLAGGRPA